MSPASSRESSNRSSISADIAFRCVLIWPRYSRLVSPSTTSSAIASVSSRSDVIGVRRSCETAATRSRRMRSASSTTPPPISCTARTAITTANAVTTNMTSASWAETNITAPPTTTATTICTAAIAIPIASWRRGEPSRRRRARAACAIASAVVPSATSSASVSRPSRTP